MLSSLITGIFALGGVGLGVLLEPVKAAVAGKAKNRQDRAELCTAFINTAAQMRSYLLALNVRHRMRKVAGMDIDDQVIQDIEENYFGCRTELRQQLLLIQFRGPDDLAIQAGHVRNADRGLRDARFELDDDGQFDRHVMPRSLKAAAQAFEAEIEKFALLARKYT